MNFGFHKKKLEAAYINFNFSNKNPRRMQSDVVQDTFTIDNPRDKIEDTQRMREHMINKSPIRNWIQFPVDSLSVVVSPRLDLKVPWTPNLSHDQPSSSVI